MPLQDSDNFIIGRGTDSYKITYEDLKDDLNYVPPPVGTINTPTVTEPNDGAGGGDTRYLKSDAITDVEGGGISTCETDLIESVQVEAPVTTGVIRRVQNGRTPNDIRAYGWDDLTDEEVVTLGVNPTQSGPFSFQYIKVDKPQKIEFNVAEGFTGQSETALWRSDTGEADSWVLDTIAFTNTPNVGDHVIGQTPALYWGVIRAPVVGSPWATSSNMDGTTWLFYGQSNSEIVLNFPSSNGFDCFETGDVVQLKWISFNFKME